MPEPELHRLLKRQLKRYVGDVSSMSPEWQSLITAVNDAYYQADDDRQRLEHTLEMTSQELLQTNMDLQQTLQSVEQQVTDRTTELTETNQSLSQTLSQLQLTQSQLIQAEKMSSLGQVAAGVAHELNNPVTFIQSNLRHINHYADDLLNLIEAYQRDYPTPSSDIQAIQAEIDLDFLRRDLPQLTNSMNYGATRITTIVNALRTFSRLGESDWKAIDLQDSLQSTVTILNQRLKQACHAPIAVHWCGIPLPKIECYASQMTQVMMNVLANAIDALAEATKFQHPALESAPALDIDAALAASAFQPDEQQWLKQQTQPALWICNAIDDAGRMSIRVIDNGMGIQPQVQPKIFDPFFTTKPVGKGIGMGLATSHQIMTKLHQGDLDCRSSVGIGSVFTMTLPA